MTGRKKRGKKQERCSREVENVAMKGKHAKQRKSDEKNSFEEEKQRKRGE